MATPLKPWERPGGSVFDSPAFVGATATNANKFDEKANHKPIVPPRPTSNNSGQCAVNFNIRISCAIV